MEGDPAATAQYQLARRFPSVFRKSLRTMAERRLPEGYDYDKHFSPSYKPWDQRVCVAPNGDLFKAIRKGKADVVTDTIERFTPDGIQLTSGERLDADIIVTATGLNVQLLRRCEVAAQRRTNRTSTSSMTYKGLMFSGIPNFAITFGYTNASWTLKADLVSEFVCRRAELHGRQRTSTPSCREHPGNDVDELPFMDFTPGLLPARAGPLPKSGSRDAVAAQAELPVRPAADPQRQDRRRVAGVHQTPCLGDGTEPPVTVYRRTADDHDAVVVAVGDLAGHERHAAELDGHITLARRRSWCSCADWCPAP